jgi:hypothetical protein
MNRFPSLFVCNRYSRYDLHVENEGPHPGVGIQTEHDGASTKCSQSEYSRAPFLARDSHSIY